MATSIRLRGGTTSQHSTFTGAAKEVTVDTDKNTIVVHDGSTSGGFPLVAKDSNGNATFDDNEKAIFGAGSDLQIYHTGSHSRIVDSGTGSLLLQGTNLQLQNGAGTEVFLTATDNAEVTLRHNNNIKLATASNGITVTGNVAADSISLNDNDVAYFGTSNDLQIYHDGNSKITDVGAGNLEITTDGIIKLQKGNTEYMAQFNVDGAVQLYYDNSIKIATTSTGVDITGTINGGDLRGDAWVIGRDNNDYFAVDPTACYWYLDGNNDMRLENDGDLHVDGNVIAYSTTTSDKRLKTDIVKIDSALDKVDQINGYTFTYISDGKKSAGVIAQEVEKVLPSAVSETTLPVKMGDDDATEYKVVQYDQLIGLLVEAVKELKAEVAELKGK